ncbi:hypothetical protein [Williamsia soli]|uniref:hypothetical protein n=1 Tax=Williamsia soli TaxID=364929 RepID=UPI001A9CCAAA|nr:hypothetical protein [Williamsia soli]
MTDEVKFTNEQWDALAEAAEVFAATLEEERTKLFHVLSKNWAGQCLEGEGIIANLKDLLRGADSSFSSAIVEEATYLKNLAAECHNSKVSLNKADSGSSERFKN